MSNVNNNDQKQHHNYVTHPGIPFPLSTHFPLKEFQEAIDYSARDDDIFIVAYPKCGQTWTQHLVYCIFNEGNPPKDGGEFSSRSPFLDMRGVASISDLKRPAAIKTHLPYDMCPQNSKSKYIMVVRNPLDTCVSYYHFMKWDDNLTGGSFDRWFDRFIEGNVMYGDYFDWVIGWLKNKKDLNVLLITYEEIKEDGPEVIKRIASFLGSEYEEKVKNDSKFVDNVLENSSIKNMKELLNPFMREKFGDKDFQFVRKGQIGDWRNLMSTEQSRMLIEKFKSKAKEFPVLMDIWQKYDWLEV